MKSLYHQAIDAYQSNDFQTSINLSYEILKKEPSYYLASNLLGTSFYKLEEYDKALKQYEYTLKIEPFNLEALMNCSVIFQQLELFDLALQMFHIIINNTPYKFQGYKNRGNLLLHLKKYEEALVDYNKALSVTSTCEETLSNYALTFCKLEKYRQGVHYYNKALSINPNYQKALNNRGVALYEQGEFNEALKSYNKAIKIDPHDSHAKYNRSLIFLSQGKLKEGFKDYEQRYKFSPFEKKQLTPQDIERINTKKVVVYADQGFGDTIQMYRYLSLLKNRGAHTIINVPPALKPLFSSFETFEDSSDFDYQSPFMSLPYIFNTTIETIPNETPYISPCKQLKKYWKKKLPSSSTPFIGIVWKGDPNNILYKKRSVPLSRLLSIVNKKFTFVSLQEVVTEKERVVLEKKGVIHFHNQLKDFSDTAALIDLMDLVITIDTSVAHLSGAIGKKTWILLSFLSEWRWLLNRNTSPWYPSARLFRQKKQGCWNSILDEIKKTPFMKQ